MPLTSARSELIALFAESLFYGVYIAMFLDHIEVLFSPHRRKSAAATFRLPVVLVTSTLFALITTHIIIDTVRLFLAYQGSQTNNRADKYYVDIKSILNIIKMSVYVVETAVSDIFLLYRCYIVWEAKTAILAFPVLLYVADIATGTAAVYTLSSIRTNSVFNRKQQAISNTFFVCTLTFNTLCSGLIAFRIWKTHKRTHDARLGADFKGVQILIVESGSAYLLVLTGEVVTYSTGSYAFNIFLDVISPLIGIVFLFIIVRIRHYTPKDEILPPRSTLYSRSSRVTRAHPSGSVVFKPVPTITSMTRMDSDGTGPMFGGDSADAMHDEAQGITGRDSERCDSGSSASTY